MYLTGSNKAQASIGMSIKLALSLILIQHAVRQRSWLVTNDAFLRLNMLEPFAAYHRVIRSFDTKRDLSPFPISILIHLQSRCSKILGSSPSPIKLFSHHIIDIDSSDDYAINL